MGKLCVGIGIYTWSVKIIDMIKKKGCHGCQLHAMVDKTITISPPWYSMTRIQVSLILAWLGGEWSLPFSLKTNYFGSKKIYMV